MVDKNNYVRFADDKIEDADKGEMHIAAAATPIQYTLDKSTLTEREKAYLNADTMIDNITSYWTKLKKELYNNFGRKNDK